MKIKKRKELRIFLLVFIALFVIINCFSVYAELGIRPAYRIIDFTPGLSFSVDFTARADSGVELEIYSSGDLKDYVKFDKEKVMGGDSFTATLNLPQTIEKPGENNLYIGLREIKEAGAGIGSRLAIEALIRIIVPYPGKYAEISFSTKDINVDEPITFSVKVESLGKEAISAAANIEIYSGEEKIKDFDLGTEIIEPQTEKTFEKTLQNHGLRQGTYKAVAVVAYDGKTAKAEQEFKVGELFVEVINCTEEFQEGKISPFDIAIKSMWNDEIDNIYAEVNVTEEEKEIDFFKTPSVSLAAWQEESLKGFFNAEEADAGEYKARITLFYENKTTEKVLDIRVKRSGKEIIIILGIAGLVALLIVIIVWLLRRRNGKKIMGKTEKGNKGKKKR